MGNVNESCGVLDGSVVQEGILTKKGGWRKGSGTGRGRIKLWKRRYFILTTKGMHYYSNKKASLSRNARPLGTLTFDLQSDVQDGQTYRDMRAEGKLGTNRKDIRKHMRKLKTSVRKHEFVLSGFEGTLMLRAESEESQYRWLANIRRIIKTVKKLQTNSYQNLMASFSADLSAVAEVIASPKKKRTRKKNISNLEVIKDVAEEVAESASASASATASASASASASVPQPPSQKPPQSPSREIDSDKRKDRSKRVSEIAQYAFSIVNKEKEEKKEVAEFLSVDELLDKILPLHSKSTIAGGTWIAFLIYTHRCYTTTDDLLLLLIKYLEKPPQKFRSHKDKYRRNIVRVLKTWVMEQPEDFDGFDHKLFEKPAISIGEKLRDKYTAVLAMIRHASVCTPDTIAESIRSLSSGHFSPRDYRRSIESDKSVAVASRSERFSNIAAVDAQLHSTLTTERPRMPSVLEEKDSKGVGRFLRKFAPEIIDVRNYNSEELCIQLMHVDTEVINSIDPKSFLKKMWKQKNANFLCPKLMHAIATWNKRCYWIASTVLMEKSLQRSSGRAEASREYFKGTKALITLFLSLATVCLKSGNYYTASCISTALKMSCIIRLKPAWDLLSEESIKEFELLELACSRKNYWREFERSNQGEELHIPHLPLVLDALYQTEVKYSKDAMDKMNFSKYKKQWNVIYNIMKAQRHTQLHGERNEDLISALKSSVHMALTDKQLYAMSYKYWPRGRAGSVMTR
ncbi:hypothetical protein AAMO2058_001259000 [Amorphochlora amoebiformis]